MEEIQLKKMLIKDQVERGNKGKIKRKQMAKL